MALYRGPSLIGLTRSNSMPNAWTSTPYPAPNWLASALLEYGVQTWHLGVLCLIGNCLLVAVYLVIQAPVMIKYPASLSVTACSYFFATIFMVLTGVSATNGLHEWVLTKTEIIAVLYAGIVASCLSYSIMTWANKVLGPSLVALYNPLQPAFSTALSTIFLGDPIYIGSIIGGVSIIVGLYLVIWARYNEERRAPMDGYLDPLIVGNPRIPETQESSLNDQ
ncbi:WAT1-related protein At4g19185-like [Miscanthus floridulus]|uniref:WAT1-related protein At4g19185-like n=1 Tax=Miscanthus floridulus TaxID=154761 RepID=UPI00345AD923